MDPAHLFLKDLALVLCVAALTTVVFQRLRQPVVLGYLLAGLFVGPNIPTGFVADAQTVRTLAELGVILLMFSLGLDFNLRKLLSLGSTAGVVAAIEIGLMLTLGYLTGQLLGWSVPESLLAGAIVAISSTMIIVRTFADRGITGKLADLVFGILVAEDLAAILILAALTAAGAGDGLSAATIAAAGAQLTAFLVAALAVGLLIIPRVMRAIVRLHRPETTLVASVGICFAAALLAQSAGYSVALGAFLAGSLVSESGMARHVEPLVRPVRDIFAAIFFVAVGMLLDPWLVAEHWVAVLVFTVVVLVGKVVGVSIGAFLTGHGTRTSVRAGMSLAQIGEFSFIIAGLGIQLGTVGGRLYPVAVGVSVLTAFATPWLVRLSEPFALYVDRRLPPPLQTFVTLYGSWVELVRAESAKAASAHASPWSRIRRSTLLLLLDAFLLAAIVIGVSVSLPQLLPQLQAATGLDSGTVRTVVLLVAIGGALPFVLGIVGLAYRVGTQVAELALPTIAAGKVDFALAPRSALAATLQIGIVLAVGIPVVVITQPFLPPFRGAALVLVALAFLAIVLWRTATNLEGHMRAGAEIVVAALSPGRNGREPASSLEDVQQLLPGLGTLVPIHVDATSPTVGKTLAELNVRGRTGATAVALCRGPERIVFPSARERMYAGDVLAVTGSHEAIAAAQDLLARGTTEQERLHHG